MSRETNGFAAIDLFSGAGGLSLGLENAGFDVKVAVEVREDISKTYIANHPNTKVLTKDIRKVSGDELLKNSGSKKITLIAGCPPCQGFSSLTRKYHKKDPRNDLVLEMARIIEEVKPEMVMMENVPGLATRGKRILKKFIEQLELNGYIVNWKVLQLADYDVPQNRNRFVLLAGKGFEIPIPKPKRASAANMKPGLKPHLTVNDTIGTIRKRAVTLQYAIEHGGPKKFNWHVVRVLKPISIQRLKALKEGQDRYSLPNRLRPKCHNNKSKGFQNVYGRMSWKQVPPTITTGCTTPCMGRFGHPTKLRTISIREAATIQTFPNSYKFDTEFMDTACELVGNALPPKFGKLAADVCMKRYLEQNN